MACHHYKHCLRLSTSKRVPGVLQYQAVKVTSGQRPGRTGIHWHLLRENADSKVIRKRTKMTFTLWSSPGSTQLLMSQVAFVGQGRTNKPCDLVREIKGCSSQRSVSSTHMADGCSQLSVTPVPGGLMPSLGYACARACTHKHTHS